GPSSERAVSLISGKAVADGLLLAGHDVFESDIDRDHLEGLDHPCDVVFPVLHGTFGESGELQEILESRGLVFVGSGSTASRIGINKEDSKRAWQRVGLPVPPGQLISDISSIPPLLPCVVKPVDGGSSIDVFICRSAEQARNATETVLAKYGQALIEQFINGTELTVGILEDRALHPIRIATSREFYDYTAKYTGSEQTHHFDLNLPPETVQQLKELALRAHRAIDARDLSRIDFLVNRQNRPYLLEINTMPGFTPTSLLPDAARHEGITFSQLVDRLVNRALRRRTDRLAVA
ncbi:MAG: D-alanine--D-alanine ligase, partial [Phycisphaerae bacterium]|nr:D-alanine--D-alanine ligase [Phycisphaerae bacterium]